jgi:hypothetical protein
MANSHRLRCAQINLKREDCDQNHSQHNVSGSHEVPCGCFCFHGSTVILQGLRVVIEKIYCHIDWNDRCRRHRRPGARRA